MLAVMIFMARVVLSARLFRFVEPSSPVIQVARWYQPKVKCLAWCLVQVLVTNQRVMQLLRVS